MKSLKLLHTKKTIYLTKGQIILTNVDIKTNSPFHGMITRTKSYVFTEIFLAVFPLESTFWSGLLMFCIIWFSNKSRAAQNDDFMGEYCGEYFCEDKTEMTSPFCLDTITLIFSLYVISFD